MSSSDVSVARARIRACNLMHEMISSSVRTCLSKYHLDDVIIVTGDLVAAIREEFNVDKKYGWPTEYEYQENIRSK